MPIQADQLSGSTKPEKVSQNTICNLDYLKRMSGGDNSFVKEMIRLFLKQVPLELEKLDVAVVTEDTALAKQVTHKLKSSASMVGAESMLAQIKEFEITAVEEAVCMPLATLHKSLQQLFIHIQAELEPLL